MSEPIRHTLAPALNEEERRFLYEQRNSAHYKVFVKAIVYLYSLECARLASVEDQLQLPKVQGRLQGLLLAKNLMLFQSIPEDIGKLSDKL